MVTRMTVPVGGAALLAAALLAAGCRDAVGPERHGLPGAVFAATGPGIALDQSNGTLNENGTVL